MKRCFAIVFLSVFLITYLLPVATLVKADVVIGDNDEVIVNENAHILGRKIALMESIPNLLNNGVTELTISNVNDLDEYLDSLWEELDDAVDYLTTGDWANDISQQLRNEALENITNYINYVGDRENIFANLLQSPTTQLLKQYVIGNNLPKAEYHPNYNTLNTFKKLSAINNRDDEPSINPNPDYISLINIANNNQAYGFFWGNIPSSFRNGSRTAYLIPNPSNNFTWFCGGDPNFDIITYDSNGLRVTRSTLRPANTILTLNINQVGNSYQGNISGITSQDFCWDQPYSSKQYYETVNYMYYSSLNNYSSCTPQGGFGQNHNGISNKVCSYTGTLYEVMSYFCNRFRNINIYVNGDAWSIVNYNPPLYPTLDIDGVLQLYGNDNPPQYDIQNGTEIDYDVLYDTIYNAIINALPIGQQDITYYDSHDNVYSPTIINNYGSDSDGENEWIESILDYAVVPKFETSMLSPIETPLTNGLSVMVTVQNTIPEEILYVLGGAFVLLLFVCVINRMIK